MTGYRKRRKEETFYIANEYQTREIDVHTTETEDNKNDIPFL